jgi:hypothetical protein
MSPKAPITAAQYLGMSTTINPPRSRLNVRELTVRNGSVFTTVAAQ